MIDLAEISPEALMADTRALARWTRLSGSAEEREAAEYVAGRLRAHGYSVRILTHDAYISLPGEAGLGVLGPVERDIACITHSMGMATPPGGVTAELVHAGAGGPDDLARAGAAGKFALIEGRATPQRALDATRAGVAGLVFISGRIPHEMCCSPVWGNPAESTADALPRVVLLSVGRSQGRELRDLCQRGPVRIRARAAVDTGWRPTPIVQGELAPGHARAERTFVLLSGHLDSWYQGAMDNGSANAAMLEVARLAAGHRAALRRGLRVAFWSGHSHGRYSSSAWYADNFFAELDERCVAHVNADSLGGVGADRFATNSMPETAALAVEAALRHAGAKLDARRVGRNSDQSFLGVGIPSVLGSVSQQDDGSLGWWWHTPEDTVDKIDPARLVRDTRIFGDVVDRLLTDPVLPLDYRASAADIRDNLESLSAAGGGRFDLGAAIGEAARLEGLCGGLAAAGRRAASADRPAEPLAINECLRSLGRILIPPTYTAVGRHAHGPALDVPFLPSLRPVHRLAGLAPESEEARRLSVDLVRARSELVSALRRACAVVEACLS